MPELPRPVERRRPWLPWKPERLILETALAADECRRRLERRTFTGWLRTLERKEPVQGKVSERGFTLQRAGRLPRHLPIAARGTFEPGAGSTRVVVELGRDRRQLAIGAVGGALLVVAFVLFGAGEGSIPSGNVLVPLGIVGLGIVIVGLTLWRYAGDAAYLAAFLKETLEAHEVRSAEP
jgi:hypothetical protein